MSGPGSRRGVLGWAIWAVPLLIVIDIAQMLRRRIDRALVRAVALLLAGVLGLMVLSSLNALVRISRSLQSLTGDSLVGLESAVALRGATREMQLELLRLRMESGRTISAREVAAYRQKAHLLMADYQAGALDAVDKINADSMKRRLGAFLAELEKLSDGTNIFPAQIELADGAALQMTRAVDAAYAYNRRKARQSIDEAGASARTALGILKLLWWSTAGFVVLLLLAYFVYRWLALASDSDN